MLAFADYCRDRWDFHRRHAYRLIDSASVVKQLECVQSDTKPANEAQVRPLTQLETPEARVEAWGWAYKNRPGVVVVLEVSLCENGGIA